MNDFSSFPKEDRTKLYNKINLTEYHIQKCIQKVKKKEPIIIDFFCHGSYDTTEKRNNIDDFLLTLAKTGESTTISMIQTLRTMKIENFVKKLLYGKLSSIQLKVFRNGDKIKQNKTLKNTELKLYHGKNSYHYNSAGNRARIANVNKPAPPIYAIFNNKGEDINYNKFFIEPDGVYFFEDSMKIWDTYYADIRKNVLKNLSNKDEVASLIYPSDLKDIHKEYGINKPKNYYESMTQNAINKRNNELISFFEMENPLFNYVKNRSFIIPNQKKDYNLSMISNKISFQIKKELIKRGIRNRPVIFFTFLQCKYIPDLPWFLYFLNEKPQIRELSDKINNTTILDIHEKYKDYISPISSKQKTRSNKQKEDEHKKDKQKKDKQKKERQLKRVVKTKKRGRGRRRKNKTRKYRNV
jgi:hypothetical protein